jgi:hypothetical protein
VEHEEQGGHMTGDRQGRTNYERDVGWGMKCQVTEYYQAHLKDQVSRTGPKVWV